jgi:PAS domain S-box-containing protein
VTARPRPAAGPDAAGPELFESAILDAPVAFALYDTDLRYWRVNRALADLNEVPLERHLGRRPSEILPGPLGQQVEEMLHRVISMGEVLVDPDYEAAGGEAARHYTSSWYPARGPDGQLRGVAVFILDITERRRSELAMRRSQARTARLLEATARLATAITVDEVLRITADLGTGTVGADRAAVALVHDRRRPIAQDVLPSLGELALRERRPIYVENPQRCRDLVPEGNVEPFLDSTDEQAWAVLPLRTTGAPFGVLRLAYREERMIEPDERVFLEALAGQCALAVERARLYEREHRAAVSLQRSLLPGTLPKVPGLELAFRYVPGATEAEIGGDWYDAFVLPCGRVALVVGDVMGKGLAAAACMGRVRSSVRAFAFSDPHPRAVLAGLDRLFASTEEPETLTTLVYAVADHRSGVIEMSHAGHPPMLVIRASGEAELVTPSPAMTPLGVPDPREVSRKVQLNPGDTLVGYTDGLIENRERSIDDGLAALLVAARQAAGEELESLVDHLLTRLLEGQHRDDDVTLLAVRLTADEDAG